MRSAVGWTFVAAVVAAGWGVGAQAQVSLADLEKKLIPAGQAAPDFDLPQVGGDRVKLSELTKKNVVLLNFWFYG